MSLDHIRNSLVFAVQGKRVSGLALDFCVSSGTWQNTHRSLGDPNKPLIITLVYQCCIIDQLSGALVFAQIFEVRCFSLNNSTGRTVMACTK